MSTLYEKGERVRVRTITSEMEAVTVSEPYVADGSDWRERQGTWQAEVETPDGRPMSGKYRLLGRPKP